MFLAIKRTGKQNPSQQKSLGLEKPNGEQSDHQEDRFCTERGAVMGMSVAIIGAGAGGFYTAAALIKELPDCRVDVLDKLPTPYGLIRGGIAPDHQSSKKIAKVFERTAMADNVRFLGNVEVGRDVTLEELRNTYDAVVLATGAPADRTLGIPGQDKQGVFGSAAFVGWYNCLPEERFLNPDLSTETAVVIGAGNVALDVARLLAKTGDEVRVTDMSHYAQDAIDDAPIKDVLIYARRGPLQAAFTHKEIKEFGELENAVTLVDPDVLPAEDEELVAKGRGSQQKNVDLMRGYSSNKGDEKPVRVHINFYAKPVEVLGDDAVTGLRMEKTVVEEDGSCVGTGEFFEVPCSLVVACIGTHGQPMEGVPYNESWQQFENEDGVIEPGLYAAGWAKRGASGTVATNHPDGVAVAGHIAELTPDAGKAGPDGLDAMVAERNLRPVSFEEWKKIDDAEVAAAEHGAPRRKFTTVEEMVAFLDA